MAAPIRVCFVCLGNICRSPQAEGLFRHHVARAGLTAAFLIDSAGTSGAHAGESPDPRTAAMSLGRGVALTGRSRPFGVGDFEHFDWIIVMDRQNLQDVLRLARHDGDRGRVRLFRSYEADADAADVPDPYYGGTAGFASVFDICDAAAQGLLAALRQTHGI